MFMKKLGFTLPLFTLPLFDTLLDLPLFALFLVLALFKALFDPCLIFGADTRPELWSRSYLSHSLKIPRAA